MVFSSLLCKASLSALKPTSCGILGNKFTTSAATKMRFSGIETRLLMFLMKSPESLI